LIEQSKNMSRGSVCNGGQRTVQEQQPVFQMLVKSKLVQI